MNSIYNKYKPKKIEDIIGNVKVIEYIKYWLQSYEHVNNF